MVLITSPEFSFLTFNEQNESCDNEQVVLLPVCDNLKVKAQFNVTEEKLASEKIFVSVCDSNCDVVYDDRTEAIPICSDYRFDAVNEDDLPFSICDLGILGDNICPNPNFDINPFNEITSEDLTFNLAFVDGIIPYRSFFMLYIEDKVYLFYFVNSVSATPYTLITIGNINYVTIPMAFDGSTHIAPASVAGRLSSALIDIIDATYGTTTTISGTTPYPLTISDIPTGSYLYDGYSNILDNISTVTPNIIDIKNGYYNKTTQKITYLFLTTTDTELNVRIPIDFIDTTSYKITYDVASVVDFTHTINIRNSSDVVVYTKTINPLPNNFYGEKIVDYLYYPGLGLGFTLEFIFTPTGEKPSSQLTLDNITVQSCTMLNITDVTVGDGYAIFPGGIYSAEDFYALMSSIIGIEIDSCETFTSCCEFLKIEFIHTSVNDDDDWLVTLNKYWKVGYIDYPSVDIETIGVDCFSYCLFDEENNNLACSNVFRKEDNCCYVTAIEYYSDENSMGFFYPSNVTNYIQLPLYLFSPEYPKKETIYRRTDGTYARLSTDIEKEYECECDFFTEQQHNKLVTALNHDTVIVTSNRLGFTSQVIQQGDYDVDWNDKLDFKAKANFKLKKYFNGKNNNCGQNECN